MKKMPLRITALLLCASLIFALFTCASAQGATEYITFDLREAGANAQIFGTQATAEAIATAQTGVLTTDNTTAGYSSYPSKQLDIDSGRGIRIVQVLNKEAFDAKKDVNGLIYDKTGTIPFKILTDENASNGILIGTSNGNEQVLTLNAEKEMSKLYIYYTTTSNTTPNITVTYADNSTDIKPFGIKGAEWNEANITTGYWGQKFKLFYNINHSLSDSMSIATAAADADRHPNIAVIDLNSTKKVKSLSFKLSDGWRTTAVIGITGQVATSEEINAYYRVQIDELLAQLPADAENIDDTNYIAYGSIVEQIEAINEGKNILSEQEMEFIASIKEAINDVLNSYSPYITVDFSQSFNAKIFADGGSAIADYDNPLMYIPAYANVSGTWVPATNRALNRPAFNALKSGDGNIYSNKGIPFAVNVTGGLAFGGRSNPMNDEIINLNGVYADSLHIMLPATKGSDENRTYKAKVTYADNTEEEFALKFKGINVSAPTDCDYLAVQNMYIYNANGDVDGNLRYLEVLELDTDFSKPVKSITFSNTDQYGGYAVIGLTAEIADENSIKADIEAKIASVIQKEMAKAEYEINGIYDLVNHYEANFENETLTGKAEFDAYYMQYVNSVARVNSATSSTDLSETKAEITFENEMNSADLLEKVTVTLNGAETKDYTATYANKVLKISFKNNLEYDKRYVITIPSGVVSNGGMQMTNAYTYAFDAVEPIGFETYSVSSNNVAVKLKNFTLGAGQSYFMTVAHIASDGSVKKSYLVKGTLAKDAFKEKTFNFEPLATGEKYVTYTLDSVSALNSIVKEKGTEPAVTTDGTINEKLLVHPVDLATNSVKIEGVMPGKDVVNIVIINPGMNISANGEYTDAVQNQISVKTAENGYYCASLKLNNQTSGVFNVYAGDENGTFFFASDTNKNDIIRNVLNSGNETLIKENLDDIYQNFGLDTFVPVTVSDDDVMTSKIIAGAPYSENDFGKVQSVIMEAAVLDLYNSSKTVNLADESLNLLYDDVTNFSKLDAKYNTTIYSAYLKTLNNAGKMAVIDAVSGNNFSSMEDLGKALLKAIFTKAVNMTDRKGVLHVEEILTKNNAAAIGLDLNTYFASSYAGRVNSAISVAGEYQDADALKLAIDTLITQYKNETPAGGGGGGGSSGGGISGGVVGDVTNNNPVIIPVENTNTGFRDINDALWAEKAINALVNDGIISGYPDNTFKPNKNITREEIIKIICVAYDIQPDSNYVERFSDASYSEWYAPYINAAYKNGITLGKEDKSFGIGEGVTRQDLLVMLYRMIEEKAETETEEFKDSADIADYAKEAVMYFASKGFVSGYEDGSFKPLNVCTRAEAAMIVYNCLGGNN